MSHLYRIGNRAFDRSKIAAVEVKRDIAIGKVMFTVKFFTSTGFLLAEFTHKVDNTADERKAEAELWSRIGIITGTAIVTSPVE